MTESIALISAGPPDISEFGLRSLSAYLKNSDEDIEVMKIFLPGGVEYLKYNPDYIYGYGKRIFERLDSILQNVDIIGISFMSNYFDRVMSLTKFLKSRGKTIIWGGIHPTVLPVESLKYADYIVVGEGEQTLLKLILSLKKGEPHPKLNNLYYMCGNEAVYFGQDPLIGDINTLPYMDYGLNNSFILNMKNGEVEELTKDLFLDTLMLERPFNRKAVRSFKIYTSRGCPHNCTYCANSTLRALAPSGKYLRFESIERVINRLELILEEFPDIGVINIFDDVFTSRSKSDIFDFCEKYRRNIKLPFQIQIAPDNIDEQILKELIQSGLYFIEMGIQSLAYNTQKLYNRRIDRYKLKKSIDLINTYKKSMNHPCYHVILDNPWETTKEKIETLNFLLTLKKPFWLKRASLVLFPGTQLYLKGKEDGIIYDEQKQIYRKNLITPEINYINFLFFLSGKYYIPSWIVKLLSNPFFIRFFSIRCFKLAIRFLINIIGLGEICMKGFRSLLKGDIRRIYSYIVRVR